MQISHSARALLAGKVHKARAVPKAVNHSGFYDKHNCPHRGSIPGPRALQSGMLPLDHCDLMGRRKARGREG